VDVRIFCVLLWVVCGLLVHGITESVSFSFMASPNPYPTAWLLFVRDSVLLLAKCSSDLCPSPGG
jgi:hypothetical protein